MSKQFEDLDIWKESCRLAVDIYREFRECKDFGFKDHIQRSGVSVPSNIAEGFERSSTAEFIRFLYIAKGSASELRTQLYIAKKLKYVNSKVTNEFIERVKRISSKIQKLINILREKKESETKTR